MSNTVLTGIDVLERDNFTALRGQRVGLVTNHTGLTRDGRATIDVLHGAPGVTLAALFSPEHGLRGLRDEHVADSTDAQTGLPIYSLFGARTQPSTEQLAGLDALVFDIQDIGCRFYTYISTLGNVLEAASAHGLRVVVLDRPNPITGVHVEGPLPNPDKLSFTAYHTIPIRHGMTAGELAGLFVAEKGLACDLTVIPCEGWQRAEWYDATGLLWTNPSPNMRALTAAALYPGVGLLEFTNISVGRGTDRPFELVGAPYVESRTLAAALNQEALPGARFIPIQFTPYASVFAHAECGGIQILVTDREALNAVQTGLTLAGVLRRLYPNNWQPEKLMTLLANKQAYEDSVAGMAVVEMVSAWGEALAKWLLQRASHLIYR